MDLAVEELHSLVWADLPCCMVAAWMGLPHLSVSTPLLSTVPHTHVYSTYLCITVLNSILTTVELQGHCGAEPTSGVGGKVGSPAAPPPG